MKNYKPWVYEAILMIVTIRNVEYFLDLDEKKKFAITPALKYDMHKNCFIQIYIATMLMHIILRNFRHKIFKNIVIVIICTITSYGYVRMISEEQNLSVFSAIFISRFVHSVFDILWGMIILSYFVLDERKELLL